MEMFTYKIPSVTIRLLTIDTTKKVSYTTSDGLPVRLASSDSFGEMMVRCFSKSGLMSASAPPHSSTTVTPADCPSCTHIQTCQQVRMDQLVSQWKCSTVAG